MILTGPRFAAAAELLAGSRWKTTLGAWLHKSPRTLRDYANGATNVPRDVRKKMAALCLARGTRLVLLASDLDPEVVKSAGIAELDKR